MFRQGHTANQSHWSTACLLVYRGYTEEMKNTFFSLVQVTFHSYQSPPEQQKCKTKKYLLTNTGVSSWATTQKGSVLKAQHMEMERIERSAHILPRQNFCSLHLEAPALFWLPSVWQTMELPHCQLETILSLSVLSP